MKNKYEYVKVIQGNFEGKWEDVDECAVKNWRKVGRANLKAYRECKDGFAYRVISRRNLIVEA